MSMISGLIDELNKSADEWNASNMFELARMCREAADTICELRGALQIASVDYRHLQDENAKLRNDADLLRAMLSQKRFEKQCYMADNAKLRELAVGMYGMLEMVDKILGNHDMCETPRPLIFGEDKSFKDVMRELGVEAEQ